MKGKKGNSDIPLNNEIILPKLNSNKERNENKKINDERSLNESDSKINFSELSEIENKGVKDNYMENQLSLLFDVFLTSYSKKAYTDLIKDIEEKEILLYCNSRMSFEILILKVKCYLKLLLKEYNKVLQLKAYNFHETDNIIQKVQNEFRKISSMINKNNIYEFEILTQVYCKFLNLLSKISLKKEDNIKSLGFISLGINMLKVFIIRKKLATNIQTYKIYSKLLLSLINSLIGDNNYGQALLYCRTLLKVIEVSQKFIYKNLENNDNENKISPIIEKKFINYAGYTFLYIGCCLEQFEKDIEAFEAYKQAKYFLDKGSITGNPFKNANILSINNSCNYIAGELTQKFNLKFRREKFELLQMQNKIERLKRLQKYQLRQNERQYRLKLIANGHIGDPFKYSNLEQKIDRLLFPSSIKNDLDRIDDELMSFVFTYLSINNKNSTNLNKSSLSANTKKLMSRYELYNILMSKDFRDFVMKTKKLQFNNPKKVSESISIIQRYLNNKMEIKFEMKQRNYMRKKTMKSFEKPNFSINLINQNSKTITNNTINSITYPTTIRNSITKTGEEREDNKFTLINDYSNKRKKRKIRFNLINSSNKNSINTSGNKINNINLSPIKVSKNMTLSTTRRKRYWKNNLNELENDFERKNFDKNLMTKNYLRKYAYYEKLSNKELNLQKLLLDFRNNNTLYNAKKAYEENDAKIITKEEIKNKFLMINEDVKNKLNVVVKDEKIELTKDSFAINDNVISSKVKSAMSKVINKYILERKQKAKKIQKLLSNEEIKQINEKNLLELNFSIKNINNSISHIRQVTGNNIL